MHGRLRFSWGLPWMVGRMQDHGSLKAADLTARRLIKKLFIINYITLCFLREKNNKCGFVSPSAVQGMVWISPDALKNANASFIPVSGNPEASLTPFSQPRPPPNSATMLVQCYPKLGSMSSNSLDWRNMLI